MYWTSLSQQNGGRSTLLQENSGTLFSGNRRRSIQVGAGKFDAAVSEAVERGLQKEPLRSYRTPVVQQKKSGDFRCSTFGDETEEVSPSKIDNCLSCRCQYPCRCWSRTGRVHFHDLNLI
ncbi:unnamed protein product [Amoebophrya sp. A25]|nr:unnamed protein product [Amoebophrya sp. A25]|eukprot:GSA25T00025622001.1